MNGQSGAAVKCPSCGGAMEINAAGGALVCPYCGFTGASDVGKAYTAANFSEGFDAALKTAGTSWTLNSPVCRAACGICGCETVGEKLPPSCPICGSGELTALTTVDFPAPDYVGAIKTDKGAAAAILKKRLRFRVFAPKEARLNAVSDKLTAVYLPYLMLGASTETEYIARFGVDRAVKDKEGKDKTVTDWGNTSGRVSGSIYRLLQSAAAFSPSDTSFFSLLEPFDATDAARYDGTLPDGGYAVKPASVNDGTRGKSLSAMETAVKESVSAHILSEKRADRIDRLKIKTAYSALTAEYLYAPVWISAFDYKGKSCRLAVNGQNGKTAVKAPASPVRVLAAVLIAAAAITAAALIAAAVG